MKRPILVFLTVFAASSCKEKLKITVVEDKSSDLSLELRSDGSGTAIGAVYKLPLDETLDIYAVERDSKGNFVRNVEVTWSLNGGIGNLNILSNGKQAQFSSSVEGKAKIKVSYLTISKMITVVVGESNILGWDFLNPSHYTFNSDYIGIDSGSAHLQKVDTLHSGDDFGKGTHVGTYSKQSGEVSLVGSGIDITVQEVLPGRVTELLGYWRFEGNLNDSSGNDLHLSANGDAYMGAPSQVGDSSIILDGTGDFASVSYDSKLDINDKVSISGWIRITETATELDVVVGRGLDPPTPPFNVPYYVDLRSNNICGGAYLNTAGSDDIVCSTTDLTNHFGKWVHFVFVKDITNYKMYVNGILENTVIGDANANLVNTKGLAIGELLPYNGVRDFKGSIDEIAIWRTALSSAEVYSIYQSQNPNSMTELHPSWTPKYSSIVGYWKMEGNWRDSSGNGHHGTSNGDATFSSNAKIGSQAGIFDGDGDYVFAEINASETAYTNIFWFKTSTKNQGIFGVVDQAASPSTSFDRLVWLNASGDICVRVFSNETVCTSGTDYADESWHFMAHTLGQDGSLIYVDSTLLASGAKTSSDFNWDSHIHIGWAADASARYYSGAMDDLALFNIQLSAADVKTIYNRQKQKYAGHYDSPVIDLGISGNWTNLNAISPLPFGKEVVTQASDSLTNYSSMSGDLSNGLIGLWRFNEASWSDVAGEVIDDSGNSYHGRAKGGANTNHKGIFKKSGYFDGIDDFIDLSTNDYMILDNQGTAGATISVWVNFSSVSNYMSVVGCAPSNWGGQASGGLRLSNSQEFQMRIYDGSSYQQATSTTNVEIGKWHLVTGSYNPTDQKIRIYVNGIEEDSVEVTGIQENGDYCRVGSDTGESNLFKGYIDEVSIWSRALTDAEIQQLYRRGANRIKYQIKSCVDSSCNCKSFNTSPIGSANDCDGDGTSNSSDTDDIYRADFKGPGGDGSTSFSEQINRDSSDMTIDCTLNTSDSDDDVCMEDEIALAGSPLATSPSFSFSDFAPSAVPSSNRYFQYRVIMEADENTSCSGDPCLPELTSIELGPSDRYYGGSPVIKPKAPIDYVDIARMDFSEGGSCALTYQLSADGVNYYYWDGASWALASMEVASESSDGSVTSANITSFSDAAGSGSLYFKAFMNSNTAQSCTINKIEFIKSN